MTRLLFNLNQAPVMKTKDNRVQALHEALSRVPAKATARVSRGNVNLSRGRYIGQEQITARRLAAAQALKAF